MNEPRMFEPQHITPGITSLVSYIPVPGYGVLPVNAFVIQARQPVLVDTGMAAVGADFLRELISVIDPGELRWIWITHTDMDHLGNFRAVLEAAPNARVVTTYIGMAKIGLQGFPLERVFLLNPGQSLDVGDRKLLALRPPTFDAPETTCLYDASSLTLFSADSFGAILDKPVDNAADIAAAKLREGGQLWASVDAPWLSLADPHKFKASLKTINDLGATRILSAHLPVAEGMNSVLLDNLAGALNTPAFVGPDQAALEKMLAA